MSSIRRTIGIYGLLTFGLFSSAQAAQITCVFDDNGYDHETIVLNLDNMNKVTAIDYTSYQRSEGPFQKISENIFEYTQDSLIIVKRATVLPDLTQVVLETRDKKSGELLTMGRQVFMCSGLSS